MLVFLCVCFHVKHFFFINLCLYTNFLEITSNSCYTYCNVKDFLHPLEGARMKTLNTARIGQIYYINKILKY